MSNKYVCAFGHVRKHLTVKGSAIEAHEMLLTFIYIGMYRLDIVMLRKALWMLKVWALFKNMCALEHAHKSSIVKRVTFDFLDVSLSLFYIGFFFLDLEMPASKPILYKVVVKRFLFFRLQFDSDDNKVKNNIKNTRDFNSNINLFAFPVHTSDLTARACCDGNEECAPALEVWGLSPLFFVGVNLFWVSTIPRGQPYYIS